MVGYGNLESLMENGVDIFALLQPEDDDDSSVFISDEVALEKRKCEKLERPISLSFNQTLDLQRSLSTPPHERIDNKQMIDIYRNKTEKSNQRISWHPVTIGSFTQQNFRRNRDVKDTQSMYIMSERQKSYLLANNSVLTLENISNHGSNLNLDNLGKNDFSDDLLHSTFSRKKRSSSRLTNTTASLLELDIKESEAEVSV